MTDKATRTTRRGAQTDDPSTLMDAARRRAGPRPPTAAEIRSGQAPLPDPPADILPPSVVPAQALVELQESILDRIRGGENALRRELAIAVATSAQSSIEDRALALKLARDHVRRTSAPLSDSSAEARLEAEMRIASFLLGEHRAVGR